MHATSIHNKFWTILIAGAFATIAFDLFGKGLSPLAGYAKLAPVGLATQSLKSIFGSIPKGSGDIVHALTGLIAYPLGWVLIARPIQTKIMPNLHWSITAVVYGIALWVFALYIMASLVAGNKPFLGWAGITYVALWGHIIYALVMAYVIEHSPFKALDAHAKQAA